MKLTAAPNHIWRSTKTYGHNVGLSCCFRQWRAEHSHCRFMHGYALKVHLEFSGTGLDERNWVMDFGGLKAVKNYLEENFDHITIVAEDDPQISIFKEMAIAGLIQLRIAPSTGVEAFAKEIYDHVTDWLAYSQEGQHPGRITHRVKLNKVSVHEHDGNSAEYGRAYGTVYVGDIAPAF